MFFFYNETTTTEIYPLSRHDALPILHVGPPPGEEGGPPAERQRPAAELHAPADGADDEHVRAQRHGGPRRHRPRQDRKSTRLNSSHANISYAVFCLKKKIIFYPSPHS